MDRCHVKPPASSSLSALVKKALSVYPKKEFTNAYLNETYGIAAATSDEGDCKVEVLGAGLVPGEQGENGGIVRIHDLYLDPALTDCARLQSVRAGHSFLHWLKTSKIRLDFIGSSFLMRAFETAYAMFVEPCSESGSALDCSSILNESLKVAPIPFMTERAPVGITGMQADNMPLPVHEQIKRIEKLYGRRLDIDTSYASSWPRMKQQYEKFKAFLATQLVPHIRGDLVTAESRMKFQDALQASLPEEMDHRDHGKLPIFFEWGDGQYETGAEFSKEQYTSLDAPELNIAIVGHNQMMSEYCQKGLKPKPNNNAVLEKLFILKTTENEAGSSAKKFVMQELGGWCGKVMDAPNGKDAMASLEEADVASCDDPFPVSKFIGVDKIHSLRDTACVKMATAKNAFPIKAEFAMVSSEL
eukprot:CAMPEP_0169096578 /NCGR_PEP_ID=MMETSP1015-20121227/19069_1 /TAXON_ID=342587 /ORGANISM="Karlodinium micrum, Strain CCMP2283" /LENGTH=415 /DNA_ID=CAMNT_0009157343 /DNA_START=123 /DNA_END=1370 /DNA_ORIENTATION=-